MMHGLEKSDSLIVPKKLANKAGVARCGVNGGKRWDREECDSASTVRTLSRASRVPSAGQHTCSH